MFVRNDRKKGFSLIEMIVVLAIFALLSSVTIYNYGDFDRNITVTNLAYEMALTIREAQSYSLSVRGNEGDFGSGYGISFNLDDGENSDQNFVFFVDTNEDKFCQSDSDDFQGSISCSYENCLSTYECMSSSLLTRNTIVKRLCVLNSSSPAASAIDYSTGQCNDVEARELSITFERPDVDALIYEPGVAQPYVEAAILLEATNGSQRVITVKENGQISVEFVNN